jgi:hypothetical protein
VGFIARPYLPTSAPLRRSKAIPRNACTGFGESRFTPGYASFLRTVPRISILSQGRVNSVQFAGRNRPHAYPARPVTDASDLTGAAHKHEIAKVRRGCWQERPKSIFISLPIRGEQSRKKSALTLAPSFGALIEKCALLLSFFYIKAGANKLVNLIWDEQVTFAELSIDVIIWISIPNKAYDLKEHFAVPPEGGITCLQKDECSATNSRIF